ncbi:MAG: thrombospondin type 3 repeat-containing protein [Deltaproteobacteria bacterium]|nr:thrombospondin type 3 repeat-containing protein [Deltaproteobacteria bacterium]
MLNRFEPAPRGSRFHVGDSLELDGNPRFTAGLVTTYGTDLRTYRQRGAEREASTLVASSLYLFPGASVVLAPGARFSLDVPIAFQGGKGATLANIFHPEPESPRMGDVRLAVDFRLVGRSSSDVDGASLAAGIVGYLPTGSVAAYTGDDFVRLGARLSTSFTKRWFLGAARVGYMYRKDDVPPFAGVEIGSELDYVLALGGTYKGVVVGPELHGSTRLNDPFQRRSTPTELLLGSKVTLGELRVGAGLGTAVVTGLGSASFRGALSVEWVPPPAGAVATDRDGDGVLDDVDVCPDVPGFREARGCPAAPRDLDHDGVFDEVDACPDLPGKAHADPMINGCPDRDGDGVPDPVDACPDEPGPRSEVPRFHGCPRSEPTPAPPPEPAPSEPGPTP